MTDIWTKVSSVIMRWIVKGVQKLLQEEYLKMINQRMPDICGPTVLEHILPKGEIREECEKVVLKVFAEEALGLSVRLHFAVVGE